MAKMSELDVEVQRAATLVAVEPEFPTLRDLNALSHAYAVGAHGSMFKALHHKLTALASSRRGSAKDLRAEISAIAKSIPDHIEWLNTATVEFEAKHCLDRGVA